LINLTREQPLIIDGLTVFPENFLISGIPCSYDSVRDISWFRSYTEVTGMSLGSDELILFSFKTADGPSFNKKYCPVFFTEGRRKTPNRLWTAFCHIAEQSYPARIAFYVDQVKQFNRWTIDGTTFDVVSRCVMKNGVTIRIANAKITRDHANVNFVEVIPHDGFFTKTKKLKIEASHLSDRDCFFALLKHFLGVHFPQ